MELKCFWCGNKVKDLVIHTRCRHPNLNPRSYDLNNLIDKSELKSLNKIIDDFNCECNSMNGICAMCAFKVYWNKMGLNDE